MKLIFRPLDKGDFQLFAEWLAKPHVHKWWHEPGTVEFVAKEYGACTDGDFTTRVYVVQDGLQPIGIIQSFMLESYPETANLLKTPGAFSIDYLIGDEDYVGHGYGTRMIRVFIDRLARHLYPDATGVATSAEIGNLASLGALRKAGFEPGEIVQGEHGPEQVMRLRFE